MLVRIDAYAYADQKWLEFMVRDDMKAASIWWSIISAIEDIMNTKNKGSSH